MPGKENIYKALKEVFVNSRDEVELDIITLLEIRIRSFGQFRLHWEKLEFGTCRDIIEISTPPLIFVDSLILFVKQNQAIMYNENVGARFSYYYILLGVLYLCSMRFVVRRKITSLMLGIKKNDL